MTDILNLDKLEQVAHRIDGCVKGLNTLSLKGYADQKTNTNIIEELTLIVQELVKDVQIGRQKQEEETIKPSVNSDK